MKFEDILKRISPLLFSEVISKAPRKVREALFSHYDIKVKGVTTLDKLKDKKEQKTQKLLEKLQTASKPKEIEFIKELFRNWLMNKRPMLKSALDYLNVKNDNGLVEDDLDFFSKLSEEKVTKLVEHLKKDFPEEEILVYLSFVEVPHLETVFS